MLAQQEGRAKTNYPTRLMYRERKIAGKGSVRQTSTSTLLSGLSEARLHRADGTTQQFWSAADDLQLPKPRTCLVASAPSNKMHAIALDQVALPLVTDYVLGTASAPSYEMVLELLV